MEKQNREMKQLGLSKNTTIGFNIYTESCIVGWILCWHDDPPQWVCGFPGCGRMNAWGRWLSLGGIISLRHVVNVTCRRRLPRASHCQQCLQLGTQVNTLCFKLHWHTWLLSCATEGSSAGAVKILFSINWIYPNCQKCQLFLQGLQIN